MFIHSGGSVTGDKPSNPEVITLEPGPRGNTGVDISGGGREARVRLIFGGLEDGGHQSRVWAGFIHSRGSVTGGQTRGRAGGHQSRVWACLYIAGGLSQGTNRVIPLGSPVARLRSVFGEI